MASKRLEILSRQLTAGPATVSTPSAALLERFLTHDNAEMRKILLEHFKDDMYRPNHYLSLMEFRELTLRRLQKFVGQKYFSIRDYMENPRRFMAALEMLSFVDYSLAIKAGVHFTLCGGTISKLGTAKHHEAILPRLDTLDLTGSFCMTELGHGSNVAGIETTAVYDPASREFVINTPTNESSKIWIGGTGQHGKVTVVFAQLTVNGKYEGIHVFVMRIRDDQMRLMPGVRIVDMGPKMGLNGVDNGQLWFDNVRVPRDAMLDAFASVDEAGNYSSSIPSVSARFGTMVGGLTTGRVLIGQGAIDAQKIGLTIALRYSAARPQFGTKTILSYLTQQSRLFPALANTYALHLASGHLKEVLDRKRPQDAKHIHVLSSGLKAAATWTRIQTLQDCRECCGGMGFLSCNKIGPMANDMNVDVTFEGDNTVLMQQVARALVDDKSVGGAAPPLPGINFSPATGGVMDEKLAQLLEWREKALTHRVAAQMASAASAAAGGGKAAAERAAAAAFDDCLDLVVALGWANIERFCFNNFRQAIAKADPSLRPALSLLAHLYGASRVEKASAQLLAGGALAPACTEALRCDLHRCYAELAADDGRLALALCDGFAIPDYLLGSPIARDWRKIGMEA